MQLLLLLLLSLLTERLCFRTSTCQRAAFHHHSFVLKATTTTEDYTTEGLEERTLQCLDFDLLLDALKEETLTLLGSQLVATRKALSAREAVQNYAMVDGILQTLDLVPFDSDLSRLLSVLISIEQKSTNTPAPEKSDLNRFAFDIASIVLLHS